MEVTVDEVSWSKNGQSKKTKKNYYISLQHEHHKSMMSISERASEGSILPYNWVVMKGREMIQKKIQRLNTSLSIQPLPTK